MLLTRHLVKSNIHPDVHWTDCCVYKVIHIMFFGRHVLMNLLSLDLCKTLVTDHMQERMDIIKSNVINGVDQVDAQMQRYAEDASAAAEKRTQEKRKSEELTRKKSQKRRKNSASSSSSSSSSPSSSASLGSALTSAVSACQKRNSETWIHIIQTECGQKDHFVKMLARLNLAK